MKSVFLFIIAVYSLMSLAETGLPICARNVMAGREFPRSELGNIKAYCQDTTRAQATCLGILRGRQIGDWQSFKDYCSDFNIGGAICADGVAFGRTDLDWQAVKEYCSDLSEMAGGCIATQVQGQADVDFYRVKKNCLRAAHLDNLTDLLAIPPGLSDR